MTLSSLPVNPILFVLVLYVVLTLLIGWLAKSRFRTANEYLNASRSLPLTIVTAAYLASNCGALEIVGLSAMAAQYGLQAFHFYWIGAIPAMVFLSLFMMPVYRQSGVRSVPEYLSLRYGPRVRLLNASATAITLLLLSGVSLYAMAQVLEVIIGASFAQSVLLTASVVLVYALVGGLRATIYNEVFQLVVMLAGLIPLAIRCGGLAVRTRLTTAGFRAHLWTALPLANPHAPMDVAGVVFGLGFVLSFGYWCTDFVLMQRAFTARTERDACQVPLWAGFGKLLFSLIVVIPGLAAYKLLPDLGHGRRFDQTLPALMQILYSPAMLGLGLTAVSASLMSGLAANVSAFASLWTEDIYRMKLRPHRSEEHYLLVGRVAICVAIAVSVISSLLNFLFTDLMEHVQLIFSVFGSPFWAIFLMGMISRRVTERGAMAGFASGAGLSFAHSIAVNRGWLHYGSTMSSNFYAASYAFLTSCCVSWLASGKESRVDDRLLIVRMGLSRRLSADKLLLALAAILLISCAAMNVFWR
jgi:SSS family solute:Na+ symporter